MESELSKATQFGPRVAIVPLESSGVKQWGFPEMLTSPGDPAGKGTLFSHHHSVCFPFSIGISSSSHWLVRVHGDISLFIPDTGNLYFFYLLFLINLL